MDKLYSLESIVSSDRPLVGEKAFNLSQLLQAGFPVVSGFVIPAEKFRELLETINWSEPLGFDLPYSSLHLDRDNPRQLQRVSQKIRQEIMAAEIPSSWISMLESVINTWNETALILRPSVGLPLNSDISGLLESQVCQRSIEAFGISIKQAWAELFRARSLFYWQHIGIQIQQLNLAILVQPLLPSVASGILSAKPTQLNIQATWGLCNSLFKGEVIPDTFIVDSETGEIQSQSLGSKTRAYGVSSEQTSSESKILQAYLVDEKQQQQYALADKDLYALIDLARLLINKYGKPFSLEWALIEETSQLYLTEINFSLSCRDYEPNVSNLTDLHIVEKCPSENLEVEAASSELDLWKISTLDNSQVTEELLSWQVAEELENWKVNHLSSDTNLTKEQVAISALQIAESQFKDFETTNIDESMLQKAQLNTDKNLEMPVAIGLAASSGKVVAKALTITDYPYNLESIPDGRILIAKIFTPDWLPVLKKAAGIIAEWGGMTCHAAIIARELGIPAVVGAANITQLIEADELLLLDGNLGKIYQLNEQESLAIDRSLLTNNRQLIINDQELKNKDKPPIATQLLVNLSQPNLIERAASLPVDGVGLLRSELMWLGILEGKHPSRWLHLGLQKELVELVAQMLERFARAFAPRPVFYRSLDLRSHEFASLITAIPSLSSSPEINPILGIRGAFSYQQNPAIFEMELAALALVQQAGYTNINLILPFVRTVEEFSFCYRHIEKAGLTRYSQFKTWIMAEVPSVLFLLPEYVKAGVQGISIGTNDLTQLILGVDRDLAQMATAFDERHPAVMGAIAQLIQLTQQLGIPCSICGQAPAQYPEIIDKLIGDGISSISVELDAFDQTYNAIARAEHRLLLKAARHQLK